MGTSFGPSPLCSNFLRPPIKRTRREPYALQIRQCSADSDLMDGSNSFTLSKRTVSALPTSMSQAYDGRPDRSPVLSSSRVIRVQLVPNGPDVLARGAGGYGGQGSVRARSSQSFRSEDPAGNSGEYRHERLEGARVNQSPLLRVLYREPRLRMSAATAEKEAVRCLYSTRSVTTWRLSTSRICVHSRCNTPDSCIRFSSTRRRNSHGVAHIAEQTRRCRCHS